MNLNEHSYKELMLEYGKLAGKEQAAEDWVPKIAEVVGDKTVSILQPCAKGIYAFALPWKIIFT